MANIRDRRKRRANSVIFDGSDVGHGLLLHLLGEEVLFLLFWLLKFKFDIFLLFFSRWHNLIHHWLEVCGVVLRSWLLDFVYIEPSHEIIESGMLQHSIDINIFKLEEKPEEHIRKHVLGIEEGIEIWRGWVMKSARVLES